MGLRGSARLCRLILAAHISAQRGASGTSPSRFLLHPGVLCLCLLMAAAGGAEAQNVAHPPRTMQIQRFDDGRIRIDGRLDEPVWQKLTPQGDFLQMDPNEGQPISERTEVLVFYDHDKLYIAFRCFDSEPAKIDRWLDARDQRPQVDSVGIFLDPFGDKRSGYLFTVHAGGHQYDGLLAEGSDPDDTWDGIWESASRIEDWGWVAEVAIPFKSVRFSTDQPWGFNVRRDIPRKNERAYWQFLPRFDVRFRPSKTGSLEGIDDIQPGRNIEVVPYFSTRFRRGAPTALNDGEKYDGGADIRWGILPNATLNLTVNPDFADTEADEDNISLSRFELFFPEKRNFFNEGSDFFRTPMDLFFTRRVGARLPDATPQRILLGAKLTGKVGPWSLGLLESRTLQQDFTDPATGLQQTAPGANFFVLRGQRDIWGNSTMGFLTANRAQQPGAIGSTQRVHAVDLNIVKGPFLRWATQAGYNQNESTSETGIHRAVLRSDFLWENNDWEYQARYKYLGRGVDLSDIGFEPETDRHNTQASITWKPFINRQGVRQVFFEINQDHGLDTSGLTQNSGSDADLRVQFTNFWSARVRYSYDLVRFDTFTPQFTRTLPTRIYITPRVRLFLNTNERRRVYLNYQWLWNKFAQFNENYYGRGDTHRLDATLRLFRATRVQFTGQYIREFLLDGTPFQIRRQFVTRVNHQFTPQLRVRLLAQNSSDRHGQNYGLNSVVIYQFTARSAAIVGYNYQKHGPSMPGDLGNEFFAKFSYLLQF